MSSPHPVPETPPSPAGPLPMPDLILRLAIIGAVLVAVAGLFAYAGGWLTPRALTPTSLVNTFETLNGPHPGFRRNHAKGVCFTGVFESNGKGAELSKAIVFAPGQVPVVGRFALAGGQPSVADAPGTVRSMALLFQLPNGEEWRAGMNNIPVFPVNSSQGFSELLIATAPDPATGKPNPDKIKALMAAHPETAKALGIIKQQPVSSGFANTTYNSLNAFLFTNDKGVVVPVRWSMVPVQPFAPMDPADASKGEKNYLFDALIADIHRQPLQWRLIVTTGRAGDSTKDATIPWPASNTQIEVGTLTIKQVDSEDNSPVRDINFDPLILPNGMAGSDDPLLSARSAAYSQSFNRRQSEKKTPSAITPSETGK